MEILTKRLVNKWGAPTALNSSVAFSIFVLFTTSRWRSDILAERGMEKEQKEGHRALMRGNNQATARTDKRLQMKGRMARRR